MGESLYSGNYVLNLLMVEMAADYMYSRYWGVGF